MKIFIYYKYNDLIFIYARSIYEALGLINEYKDKEGNKQYYVYKEELIEFEPCDTEEPIVKIIKGHE